MENHHNDDQKLGLIRHWLTDQPHLPQISENDIRRFLHCNYDDVEAAKKTIENYYTFRTSCKDFFANRDLDDPAIKTAMSLMMFTILPRPTLEGCRIVYCRLMDTDTTNYVHLDTIRMLIMCFDLWMKEEAFAPGHIIIVDMEGMHLGHMAKFKLWVMKNYLYYIQEALPIRLKQLHFLNVVSFIDKLMFLIRPFLRKRVLDMINMHTSKETLLNFVPLACLPEEYGGEAGTFEDLRRAFNHKLVEAREDFLEDEKRNVVDESKRKAKPRRYMFGLF